MRIIAFFTVVFVQVFPDSPVKRALRWADPPRDAAQSEQLCAHLRASGRSAEMDEVSSLVVHIDDENECSSWEDFELFKLPASQRLLPTRPVP